MPHAIAVSLESRSVGYATPPPLRRGPSLRPDRVGNKSAYPWADLPTAARSHLLLLPTSRTQPQHDYHPNRHPQHRPYFPKPLRHLLLGLALLRLRLMCLKVLLRWVCPCRYSLWLRSLLMGSLWACGPGIREQIL